MTDRDADGLHDGAGDVTWDVDETYVSVAPDDPPDTGEDDVDEAFRPRQRFAAAAAAPAAGSARLRRLIERVPTAASGAPSAPRSGSAFRVVDSLGASMDALDVIANPVVPGSYLGVYHISIGGGRFALRLAASSDLRSWRKIGDLDAGGGGMGTLRALPGGGFLLAYEAQGPTRPNAKVDSNVRLRYYRDAAALLSGRWAEQRNLPRKAGTSNQGTPDLRTIQWHGSLASSRVALGFHWLDHAPKLAVDRQARATLDSGNWKITIETGIDLALSRKGFHGNHGARRQFAFPKSGKTSRVYEAQKVVNNPSSWRVFLYDVSARRFEPLAVATPRASRSFANPTARILRSPHPGGGDALVVTMFIFGEGAGSGESGELVYYVDL